MRLRSAVVGVALIAAACDKVPLTAPTNSTITLSAATRTVGVNGSLEITAMVLESAGTPVQNGTTVRFTTNLGTLDPVEAQTRNGIATTTFNAGTSSGVAQIRATSGAAGGASTGTGTGGTATTSNQIEISVGAAAAGTLTISASAATVPSSGGTVSVMAIVTDTAGNRVGNVPVTFTTTAGTLSASSVNTNSNGEATAQLTTNRTATVTARVGSGDTARTGTVTINAATANSISVAVTPTTTNAGAPVTLTVTPTVGANNVAPRVSVNWGDGRTDDLGTVAAARTVSHIYTTAGTYNIVATATADGETTSASAPVTITPSSVTVSATPTSGPQATTTFSFTITPAPNQTARNVGIDFGDDSSRELGAITQATTVTKRYSAPGQYTVRVTQLNENGTTSTAVIIITVT